MKKKNVMKSMLGVLPAIALMAGLVTGCGGGGGSAAVTPAVPVTTAEAKNSAQKSVNETLSLNNFTQFQTKNYVGGSRVAGRIAAAVTESGNTTTYTDEVDSSTGCKQNGVITATLASNTSASLSGSITLTECTDIFDNGVNVLSGTLTQAGTNLFTVAVTNTFTQAGTTLAATMPLNGTYNESTDTFTPSGAMSITFNGTDTDGDIFTNFVVTEGTSGSVSISGRLTDSAGYYMDYTNTTFASDNSAVVNFTTSDGVTGSMTVNSDGSGSATLTQTSDSSALLTMTWTSANVATITYADNTTEQITITAS